MAQWTTPVVQVQHSYRVYMVLTHRSNTFDKSRVRRYRTSIKWASFIHHPEALMLYTYVGLKMVPHSLFLPVPRNSGQQQHLVTAAAKARGYDYVPIAATHAGLHPSDLRGRTMLMLSTTETIFHLATALILLLPRKKRRYSSSQWPETIYARLTGLKHRFHRWGGRNASLNSPISTSPGSA